MATKKAQSKTSTKPVRSGKATTKSDGVMLRIRVRAYENKILDNSVKQIIDTATRHDATILGPVPLPTEIKKYTVNSSPFVYKDAREQFEIRTHKRLLDMLEPTQQTIDALMRLDLSAGVDVEIKL